MPLRARTATLQKNRKQGNSNQTKRTAWDDVDQSFGTAGVPCKAFTLVDDRSAARGREGFALDTDKIQSAGQHFSLQGER